MRLTNLSAFCGAVFFLTCLTFSPISVSVAHAGASPIDWSQPPVGCAEEMIPSLPNRPCLDLTQVSDPNHDWPVGLPDSELHYWQSEKEPILYCRALEVLRRESLQPGSSNAGDVEYAWLQTQGVLHTPEKTAAVYEASLKNHIPVQVLTGAIVQESVFAELGIGQDGGNYSCGIGQGSIIEWCHWANEQTLDLQKKLGWTHADCDLLQTSLIEPFYQIAVTHLNGRPEYELNAKDFAGITFAEVAPGFPAAGISTHHIWFQLAQSFIQNCSNPSFGIAAKANELALIYRDYVPSGLKTQDRYLRGTHFNRKCLKTGYAEAYPLNQAWLMAVGIYNSGPRAVDALAYYNFWSRSELEKSQTWVGFTPQSMIDSFYGAGVYNPKTDEIDFMNLENQKESWIWFKPCVLQRHIARVIQHVTLVDQPDLVESLEGSEGCLKSTFDPKTGALVQSAVPVSRQTSSGRRPSPFF